MTNSEWVADALNIRCRNDERMPQDRHRHVQLIGGKRANKAQEYPRGLCLAMVEGMKRQLECDEWGAVKVNMNRVKLFGVVKKKEVKH